MVKVPVKRKQKQKIKQKVKVSQNVKVIVGDVKRKRAVKRSGSKPGSSAKPPIILNISNPQPLNNAYFEYFKKQLQNQQPIQANTLREHERLNEIEERKASKAGALHKLDQEPDDVARELRAKAAETRANVEKAEQERKLQEAEMSKSVRKIPKETKQASVRVTQPTPSYSIIKPRVASEEQEEEKQSLQRELEQRQTNLEQLMEKSSGAGAGAGVEDIPVTPIRQYSEPKQKIVVKKRRGRKPLSEEIVQARLEEEARLRRERIGMEAEDIKPRRGRKLLSQDEMNRRRKERELQKLERLFQETDTD